MMRSFKFLQFAFAAILLAFAPMGCARDQGTMVAPPAPSAAPPDYQLGTGDKVRVTVYGEDDLSGEFDIDGSGYVRLPLVGQVKAAGLSVHAFEGAVTEKLKAGYLKNPRVSVEITNYRPFYIIGEVNKPGEYPYVNNMTVLNAVALAGGYTYRASESEVYVRRNGSKDEAKEPADGTAKILPGDIVRVPERLF
jgi:protein involved in polysaccharide export with SLBB domain